MVTLSRGLGGLLELSFEVDADRRGQGLGRSLLREALALAPLGEPLLAAVAPGNAASLRALLAAGFTPLGSVQLVRPGDEPRGARQSEVPLTSAAAGRRHSSRRSAPEPTPPTSRCPHGRSGRSVGSRRTVSSCPCGHGAGSSARAMGRLTSKVVPHARHLTSYLGTVPSSFRRWSA